MLSAFAERVAGGRRWEITTEPMDEQRHVALPKLYGAPAYARPPVVPAAPAPRPISPDDLPIAAEMTEEDLGLLSIHPVADGPAAWSAREASATDAPAPAESLQPRPFSIRALAERIRSLRP